MDQVDIQTGKGRKKTLWVAAAIIVVIAGGAFGAKAFYEKKVNELITRGGGTAASVKVDFLAQIHLRDLTIPLGDGATVRIKAVDGRPKLPVLDGILDMTGIDIEFAAGNVSMAQMRVENASVATLAEGARSVPQRIESFSARKISSPELIVTQSFAGTEQKSTYKDIALTDIAKGIIAGYSAGGASFDFVLDMPVSDGVPKKTKMVGSTAAIAGQDVDVAYLARLYTEKDTREDREAKLLYGPFSIKTVSFSDGDSHFSYDEIRSDSVMARMPSEPLLETLKNLTATSDPDKLSPEERKALFTKTVSLLDVIGKFDLQFLGMKVDAHDKNETDPGKRVKFTTERMAMKLENRKLSGGLHGMSIGSGEDIIQVGEASITGFDLSSTLKGLAQVAALDQTEIDNYPFYQLMPDLGTMRFAGINVDMANPEKSEEVTATQPERIKFSLKNFEITLTKPFNGIPTEVRIKQEDLSIPVPADSTDEAFVGLRKLGFERLTFSYAFDAGWDKPNDNLVIREISASSKELGSINMSALISGFTEEFFSLDMTRTQGALFGLAGREVKLTVKDEGLMAKAIKLYAEDNGMTEEQVSGMLALVVNVGLQEVVAEHPELQNAVEAIQHFISAPGTLDVTFKSKGPNGLGAFDLMAASQSPMLLLNNLDIKATAH